MDAVATTFDGGDGGDEFLQLETPPPELSKGQKTWREIKRWKSTYVFIAPFMILFFVFTFVPIIVSFFISFTYFNMMEFPRWIWFDNFTRMFLEDELFFRVLMNTLTLAVLLGPVGYIVTFIYAWLINELPKGLRVGMTIIFFAPGFGGLGMFWGILFSHDSMGYLNGWLLRFGLINTPILFRQVEFWMLFMILLIGYMGSIGAGFLIFIGALNGVDASQLEAAAVDGVKNRWAELWYVVLPNIRPQLALTAILSITGAFGVGGVVTEALGNPSYQYRWHTLALHMDDVGGVRWELGYASAMALVLMAMSLSANKGIQAMIRKIGE